MSPADREHRFGHGKAEPLAVLGQSAFITGSAMLLLAEAVRRLIWPVSVENPSAGIVVMVFSIVVTIGLVSYQRHVVRRTGSIAISADELHYRSDIVVSEERLKKVSEKIEAPLRSWPPPACFIWPTAKGRGKSASETMVRWYQ